MTKYSFVNDIGQHSNSFETPFDAIKKATGCILRVTEPTHIYHVNVKEQLQRYMADLALLTVQLWTKDTDVLNYLTTLDIELLGKVRDISSRAGLDRSLSNEVGFAAWMAYYCCCNRDDLYRLIPYCVASGRMAGLNKYMMIGKFNIHIKYLLQTGPSFIIVDPVEFIKEFIDAVNKYKVPTLKLSGEEIKELLKLVKSEP